MMIHVGLDDTDMPDTPGTNKLAMHLAERLAGDYVTRWIVRYQMLNDPRIPCTNRNGSVAMGLEARDHLNVPGLIEVLREILLGWCPPGSDPGLCVCDAVPREVSDWGRRAQREVLTQAAALQLAREHDVYLEPLGGTGGGVIGALAAVGLLATLHGGRVVHRALDQARPFDVTGIFDVAEIHARGVDRVIRLDTAEAVLVGAIDLGKRLRPNLRQGEVCLFVLPAEPGAAAQWQAPRVVE